MSSIELEWRNYLLRSGIIAGQNEAKKREEILVVLRSLIPSFIQLSGKENNTKTCDFECQLVPFGSYALGGHLSNGDIDVVLLAPSSVRRRDFTKIFTKLLKNHPIIRDVESIPRANVPIIKCVIDSIPIDISFVRLHRQSVPSDIDLLDNTIHHRLDNLCLASTDGPRVGKFILNQIQPNDLPAFRLTLQCIKHWANQRFLYGKPMGYLNGGAWALLLLKTYMTLRLQNSYLTTIPSPPPSKSTASIYHTEIPTHAPCPSGNNVSPTASPSSSVSISPTLSASSITPTPKKATPLLSSTQPVSFISLLKLFFQMWCNWPWPKPVILTNYIPTNTGKTTNDSNSSDDDLDYFKTSLLPIGTPCYPMTSAAPLVTRSTLSVLMNELERGNRILQSDTSCIAQYTMDKLFNPLHVVKSYKHFIKVTVSCETAGNHDIWSRRTPSSLPRLVELLESAEEIKVARPFTKSYTDTVTYRCRNEKELLISGQQVDGTETAGSRGPGSLYRRFFLIGLEFHDCYKNSNTLVDLSEIIKTFDKEINGKKNSKDTDVNVLVSAIKRRNVLTLIQNENEPC